MQPVKLGLNCSAYTLWCSFLLHPQDIHKTSPLAGACRLQQFLFGNVIRLLILNTLETRDKTPWECHLGFRRCCRWPRLEGRQLLLQLPVTRARQFYMLANFCHAVPFTIQYHNKQSARQHFRRKTFCNESGEICQQSEHKSLPIPRKPRIL